VLRVAPVHTAFCRVGKVPAAQGAAVLSEQVDLGVALEQHVGLLGAKAY
jgi:hypothetical protein